MSLDAIGIVTKDIKRSVEFYSLLGIELSEVGGSPEHLEGTCSNGLRLMLDSYELMSKINPDYKGPNAGGAVLAFKQLKPSKVDELFKKMIESKFEPIKTPWDAFWGQRYASVKDPSGNQIDLFAQL